PRAPASGRRSSGTPASRRLAWRRPAATPRGRRRGTPARQPAGTPAFLAHLEDAAARVFRERAGRVAHLRFRAAERVHEAGVGAEGVEPGVAGEDGEAGEA